ncbi:hypothetical protein NMY22_g3903 [Coprinellus aureogranulatus]|nr:hypothetical protein NMY22_g3903 [Coprinellus aureogranulatus]
MLTRKGIQDADPAPDPLTKWLGREPQGFSATLSLSGRQRPIPSALLTFRLQLEIIVDAGASQSNPGSEELRLNIRQRGMETYVVSVIPPPPNLVSRKQRLEASFIGEDAGNPTTSSFPSMPTASIAFACNVTPDTFNDPPPLADEPMGESILFPEDSLEGSSSASSSRKVVHGRKKPDNYIPRPPNAFILFRSAFIRSRTVSTDVETNHSTLSKIIGMTWQNLPEEERRVWHRKAKQAEAEHRKKFPQYAFKPVHSKKGGTKRKAREVGPKDQKRCAKIAELLVQGKKGKELDDAVQEFDKTHVPEIVMRFEAPITEHSFSRSCSAPAPEREAPSPRKPRCASSASSGSRRSTPASALSISPSPAPPSLSATPSLQIDQDPSLYTMPPLDQYTYEQAKSDTPFVSPVPLQSVQALTVPQDFSSFSFNNQGMASTSLPSFGFEPLSQPSNRLDHTFSQHHSSQPNQIVPQLQVDTSYIGGQSWSPCHSPGSPSTSSMPPTPAYAGAAALPEESYGGYTNTEPTSDYSLHGKPMPTNLTPSQFGTYQDSNTGFSGGAQYTDINCAYSSINLVDQSSSAPA